MPGRITHAQEDWDDRGHIPAHDVKDIQRYLLHLISLRGRARRAAGGLGGRRREQRLKRQIQRFTTALLRHRMSYDNYTRPRQEFSLPRMTEPWNELTDSRFKKCTRFYKKEFLVQGHRGHAVAEPDGALAGVVGRGRRDQAAEHLVVVEAVAGRQVGPAQDGAGLGVLGEPGEQGHVEGETVGDEVRGAVQTGAAQVRQRHHGLLTCTLYLAALFIYLQVSGAMVYASQLWTWQPLCS